MLWTALLDAVGRARLIRTHLRDRQPRRPRQPLAQRTAARRLHRQLHQNGGHVSCGLGAGPDEQEALMDAGLDAFATVRSAHRSN